MTFQCPSFHHSTRSSPSSTLSAFTAVQPFPRPIKRVPRSCVPYVLVRLIRQLLQLPSFGRFDWVLSKWPVAQDISRLPLPCDDVSFRWSNFPRNTSFRLTSGTSHPRPVQFLPYIRPSLSSYPDLSPEMSFEQGASISLCRPLT